MEKQIISYVQSLTKEPINKKCRFDRVTYYRHLAIFLLKAKNPGLSCRKVVHFIGFDDYTIVGYVCKKIEGRMKVDSKFRKEIQNHLNNINQLICQPI